MDNNDSNLKSQQTGGLKLMTVFIAVLALHVVVIGGFTVYHLMSGGTTDADMTTTDKSHKGLNSDGTMPDASQGDKSTTTTPATEVATIPASPSTPATTASPTPTPAPASDATASNVATAAAPTPATTTSSTSATTPATASAATPSTTPAPAPTLAPTVPAPAPSPAAVTEMANPGSQAPTGPISPELAPPPDQTPITPAPPAPLVAPAPVLAPAASLAAGPVHMPPAISAPEPARTSHAHEQIYVVKITDSYKKIAHKHHVTVAQLKEANHIKGDVLHTGQKLFIPSEKSLVAENASGETSTLASAPIASTASESVAPMTTSLNSTSVATTGTHHHFYTVVKGDTLTKIAHRFKTTPSAIMAENGITDPTKLSIGKKLRIPSEESRSARNNVPASTQPGQVQAKGNSPTAQLANFAQ